MFFFLHKKETVSYIDVNVFFQHGMMPLIIKNHDSRDALSKLLWMKKQDQPEKAWFGWTRVTTKITMLGIFFFPSNTAFLFSLKASRKIYPFTKHYELVTSMRFRTPSHGSIASPPEKINHGPRRDQDHLSHLMLYRVNSVPDMLININLF